MEAAEPTADEIQRGLAAIRRSRRIALAVVLAPVVLTAALVVINRLTDGAMHVLVSGAWWNRPFWYTLLAVFAAGGVMLLANVQRRCPRCGQGFFVSKFYRRTTKRMSRHGGNLNIFAGRCLNCGLRLSGK